MICQYNLAWMREPWEDPIWDSWRRAVPHVHARARTYPGFIGLLAGDPYLMPYPDEPLIMGNLSMWRDEASLFGFLQDPAHQAIVRRRTHWFTDPEWRPWAVYYHSDGLSLPMARSALRTLALVGPRPRIFGTLEFLKHVGS